ncbi:MAG TPA: hypothetical protein VFK44_06590 [Bacillales bacterium]|nr:hypothetical protein [Bacillales bacterium]
MKLAICVIHQKDYEELKEKLLHLGQNDLYIYPHLSTYETLVHRISRSQVDRVILDHQFSFLHAARTLCDQYRVDLITFQGDVINLVSTFESPPSLEKQRPLPYHLPTDQANSPSVEPQEVVVKIGEKIVEREIEMLRYANIPQKTIVIGSLWSGAGATLFSTNLARAIADRKIDVAYVEYPPLKPYMFDYLNIRQLEEDLSFSYQDHAKCVSDDQPVAKAKGLLHKGVRWIVNDSRSAPVENWTDEKMMKLMYSLREIPILIVDVATRWNAPAVQSLLVQADEIYVCVEPDPVKIDWASTVDAVKDQPELQLHEYQALQTLRTLDVCKSHRYAYIETKIHPGLKMNTWHECLEQRPLSSLNYIPYEDVMKGVWDSEFLYDDSRYCHMFEKSFQPLLRSFLPKKYADGRKKDGLLKKWMKRGHAE